MTKIERMSDFIINSEASRLSKNLVNFEGHLWRKDEEGIWTNTTENSGSKEVEFAIRNQVKKHLPEDVALADIDKVKKELQTILTEQKYSLSNIKPAIRFANKKLEYVVKDNKWNKTNKVDFSPFQLKRALPKGDIERADAVEFVRYMNNLTGGDNAKEQAIYEFCGYVLAGEHSGVALALDGHSGVGKSTLAAMLDAAIKVVREDKIMLKLNAEDIYSNKGDNFAFANGVEKQLWVVGEGSNVMEDKAIKKFNDLVDETSPTFPIRRMNQAPTNAPKFWNMLLLTNGGLRAFADSETMQAFKNRLVIIESTSKKGVLTTEEWGKLFSGKNIEYFMQESIRGYWRAKQKGGARNKKFTQTTVENFWETQDESYVFEKIIKEDEGIGGMWKAGTLEHLTNDEIDIIIEAYKDKHRNFNKKYTRTAFKNEMVNAFNSGLLPRIEAIDKRKSKRINGVIVKPMVIEWKKED